MSSESIRVFDIRGYSLREESTPLEKSRQVCQLTFVFESSAFFEGLFFGDGGLLLSIDFFAATVETLASSDLRAFFTWSFKLRRQVSSFFLISTIHFNFVIEWVFKLI